MKRMKKQQFLLVDYRSTVKLSRKGQQTLGLWLSYASRVTETMAKSVLLPDIRIKHLRVSLLICGEAAIRRLNCEHRGKDKVTDVLSFPAHESLRKKLSKEQLHDGELFLGDMAICLPQACRQAKAFSIDLWDEFIHLFIHGLLHLMGHDHEVSVKEEKIMQSLEDEFLKRFSALKN